MYKRLGEKEIEKIRKMYLTRRYTIAELAEEWGVSSSAISYHTKDLNPEGSRCGVIQPETIKAIRHNLSLHIHPKDVANKLNIDVSFVYYHGKDIIQANRKYKLPKRIVRHIQHDYKYTYLSESKLAELYNVPVLTIHRYTKDLQKTPKYKRNITLLDIDNIRNDVKQGMLKSEVGKKYGISREKVKSYTKDIPSIRNRRFQKFYSDLYKIKRRLKQGELKQNIAHEYNVGITTVYKYTKNFEQNINRLSVSQEDKHFIVNAYLEGVKAEELAKSFNINVNTVYNYVHLTSGYIKKGSAKKINNYQKQKMFELYNNSNLSMKEIADLFNISKAVVWKYVSYLKAQKNNKK